MKYAMIAAAIAGSASCALAQNFSLTLVPSTIQVLSEGSFTITVYGDADVGTHMLGGAFALESNGDCIASMSWTPAPWSSFNTDGGYAGDGDYDQVIFGQLVLGGIFPPAPGSELGGAIGSFLVTAEAFSGDMPVDFQLVAGAPFTLETVDQFTGETFQDSIGNLSLGSTTVLFGNIPSPGVLSTACLGGLLASRRRRVK